MIEAKDYTRAGTMNKIATYLNEHLLGEATSAKSIRRYYSTDGSILTATPELVVFPIATNDVRKVMRFTWQLAERGHAIGVTARGGGNDQTGAAVGPGVVIDLSRHLNQVINFLPKDRLIHVQPGARIENIQEVLNWHGLKLPYLSLDSTTDTVGGLLASNLLVNGGTLGQSLEKIEVILANGDVIEVKRQSKHELNRKLGLQTFEGEIYRKISGIIEENEEMIGMIAADPRPNTAGYPGIGSVRGKDGSIDLTPLFLGSQKTLGIISEVVLRAGFYSKGEDAALLLVDSRERARDISDTLTSLEPSYLRVFEGELINRARAHGRQFSLLSDDEVSGSLVLIKFNDINDRTRSGKMKRLQKAVEKAGLGIVDTTDHAIEEFEQIERVHASSSRIEGDEKIALPLLTGAHVPSERREEFFEGLDELAKKQHTDIPVSIDALSGTIDALPQLKLSTVGDKQKVFRLLTAYATLVNKCDGMFIAAGGEGRLKAHVAWTLLEDAEAQLYEAVRLAFDPFATLNPHVKQKTEVRSLVAALRTSYDAADTL